jgi:hypothetical protein
MAHELVDVIHDDGLTSTVPEAALSVYEKSGWRRAENITAERPAPRRPRRSTNTEPVPALPTTESQED